ncbi:hypothetical protein HD554DRAFT_2040142 [Boletus coccyginus]|nr:hypothetical protein HD554DRAFT_2040142 [Boletus coccyginus]
MRHYNQCRTFVGSVGDFGLMLSELTWGEEGWIAANWKEPIENKTEPLVRSHLGRELLCGGGVSARDTRGQYRAFFADFPVKSVGEVCRSRCSLSSLEVTRITIIVRGIVALIEVVTEINTEDIDLSGHGGSPLLAAVELIGTFEFRASRVPYRLEDSSMIELGENKGRLPGEEFRDASSRGGVAVTGLGHRKSELVAVTMIRTIGHLACRRAWRIRAFERDRALRGTQFDRVAKGPVPWRSQRAGVAEDTNKRELAAVVSISSRLLGASRVPKSGGGECAEDTNQEVVVWHLARRPAWRSSIDFEVWHPSRNESEREKSKDSEGKCSPTVAARKAGGEEEEA